MAQRQIVIFERRVTQESWPLCDRHGQSQCLGAGADYTHRSSADVILKQEVKLPEGEPSDSAEQAARNAKWKLATESCLVTAKRGRSAGAAVATRNYIGMSVPKAVEASQSLHARRRFAMERVAAMGKGGIHCGSAYMFNGVGIAAKCNLDLLDTMAFTLSGLVGPWIIGGDWNCTPAELEPTGWSKKVGGLVHAPQAATCNGKVYDFSSWQLQSRTTSKAHTSLVTLGSRRTLRRGSCSEAGPGRSW